MESRTKKGIVIRQAGRSKILSQYQFHVLYRVNKEELTKIGTDLPGIDLMVTHLPEKVPHKPYKIAVGAGNFSSIRLAKRVFSDGQSKYYALRKIKEGSEQHQEQYPRKDMLTASDKEIHIHETLRTSLEGSVYLSYVALILAASRSENRKQLEQVYEFIPLAEMGDAKKFFTRFYATKPCKADEEALIASFAKTLIIVLNAIHNKHFYLLDIKLDNILMNLDGRVLFSDLGSAACYSEKTPVHALTAAYGKYLPPKILFKKPSSVISFHTKREMIDRRHDVWSLGLTLLSVCDPELEEEYTDLSERLNTREGKAFSRESVIKLYDDLLQKIKNSSDISTYMKSLLVELLNPNFDNCKSLNQIVEDRINNEEEMLETARKKISETIRQVLDYEKKHGHVVSVAPPSVERENLRSYYSRNF